MPKMEERIFFISGSLTIEGLLEINSRDKAVVITHPHPLYGGNMDNPVVDIIRNAYRSKGYTTLRFNFRGVGESGGTYDSGIGEQEDVCSAISYLKEKDITSIDLAGYSFGTYVNAGAVLKGAVTERMVMVSPPVAMMKFSESFTLSCPSIVITGSRDEIAPAGLLTKMLPRWNPEAELKIIEGADHFYSGCFKRLESALRLTV
jgi:uncharacterized protein